MAHDHEDIIDCMARHTGDNQPFVVATVVRTEDSTAGKPGDKAIVRADGSVVGWIGGGCTLGAVKKAAAAALQDGKPRMIRVRPKDKVAEEMPVDGLELHASSCPSQGTTEVFIDPVLPRPRILVVGTSPVAKALCGLAKALGYVVTVAGAGGDLAEFEDADHLIEGRLDLPEGTPPFRYVVVSSQGKRDRDALIFGLSTQADYVAFVGSRRKAEKLKTDLLRAGHDPERIAAVRSPAGLHIGAVTPDEIALSILADIVRERRLGHDAGTAAATEAGARGRGQLPEWAGTWERPRGEDG